MEQRPEFHQRGIIRHYSFPRTWPRSAPSLPRRSSPTLKVTIAYKNSPFFVSHLTQGYILTLMHLFISQLFLASVHVVQLNPQPHHPLAQWPALQSLPCLLHWRPQSVLMAIPGLVPWQSCEERHRSTQRLFCTHSMRRLQLVWPSLAYICRLSLWQEGAASRINSSRTCPRGSTIRSSSTNCTTASLIIIIITATILITIPFCKPIWRSTRRKRHWRHQRVPRLIPERRKWSPRTTRLIIQIAIRRTRF